MKALHISEPRAEESPRRAGMVRVSVLATYPGRFHQSERLWYEVPSDTAGETDTSGNAWLLSVLPLAITYHWPISMSLPVDRQLLANARQLMETWSDWNPGLHPVPLDVPGDAQARERLPEKTGAFFSGGVDSTYTVFHAARTQDEQIDDLIFLHGFDIPLGNDAAFGRAFDNARPVADLHGLRLIQVATNLRETRFQETNWAGLSFGGLLAGAGLALGKRYRRILISSGLPADHLEPQGSHPETDPLFSSQATTFVHYGPELHRVEKLEYLANHPNASANLRVCYESRDGVNCGRCLKCLSVMAILEVEGRLGDCPAFPADKLDLELLRHSYINQGKITFAKIQKFALKRDRSDVAQAIDDAVRRTQRLDRVFGMKWIGSTRERLQSNPFARRATSLIRPLLWRFGGRLNRLLP